MTKKKHEKRAGKKEENNRKYRMGKKRGKKEEGMWVIKYPKAVKTLKKHMLVVRWHKNHIKKIDGKNR